MKRLELEYQIEKMSTIYEESTVTWDNAKFTFNKELTANLKIWEDDIETEQIANTSKKLEERGESIRIALKYLGNHHIIFKKINYSTYHFNDQKFILKNEAEIEVLIKYLSGEIKSYNILSLIAPSPAISMSTAPVPLPQCQPLIPLNLHGMAETLILADELVKYPDLVLKLAFLILG